MEDLISIIVPVYNVEQYLSNCIDSILNQTYKKIECILIDDGSYDTCPQICDKYAQEDDRIIVIHKENRGLSAARNDGIKAAKGKYIVFIDSDDFIDKNMIKTLYELLIGFDADISICNFSYYSNGAIKQDFTSPLKDEVITGNEAITKLFEAKNWFYVVAWNKLYKKDIWDNIKYPEGYIHEDEAVIHRVFDKCKKIVVTSKKLYFYRQVPGSIMGNYNNISHLDIYPALADRILFLRKKLYKTEMNILLYQFLYKYYIRFYKFYNMRDGKVYIKRMKKSLLLILPIILKTSSFSFKDKIGILIFLISPKLFKNIIFDRRNNHEQ